MRILIHGINFYPEPVGTGKYTGEMAMWLASRGHQVRVVTSPPHNPQWRVLRGWSSWKYSQERISVPEFSAANSNSALPPAEIMVFRCPIWVPSRPNGLKRLIYLASFGMSSFGKVLLQLFWQPDLIILIEPTLFCSFQVLALSSCSSAKTWLHVQDFEVDAAFKLDDFSSSWICRCVLHFERMLLSRFDRVSSISDRMVDRLKSKGVDESRCVLFPNWVKNEEIRPLLRPSVFRQELSIDKNAVVALYSGSMGKKQGLELLAEAARRLTNRTDLHFVFCGDGSYRQILADMVKDLPNVTVLPLQPPELLNELLNLADIHLLPQRADAADLVMPSKLTGMLASGRPVVVTADPGTQLEQVVMGKGLVVAPGDLDGFVAAILQLTSDNDLRTRLGCEARKYSLAYLDWRRTLSTFERAILSLCDNFSNDDELDRELSSSPSGDKQVARNANQPGMTKTQVAND
jgi:colanic acid biosynthesis glycosyl transferase WcaI